MSEREDPMVSAVRCERWVLDQMVERSLLYIEGHQALKLAVSMKVGTILVCSAVDRWSGDW